MNNSKLSSSVTGTGIHPTQSKIKYILIKNYTKFSTGTGYLHPTT